MFETVKAIKHFSPKLVLVENVMRFGHCDPGDSASPLDILKRELQEAGYSSEVRPICLSDFHSAVRQRFLPRETNDRGRSANLPLFFLQKCLSGALDGQGFG